MKNKIVDQYLLVLLIRILNEDNDNVYCLNCIKRNVVYFTFTNPSAYAFSNSMSTIAFDLNKMQFIRITDLSTNKLIRLNNLLKNELITLKFNML